MPQRRKRLVLKRRVEHGRRIGNFGNNGRRGKKDVSDASAPPAHLGDDVTERSVLALLSRMKQGERIRFVFREGSSRAVAPHIVSELGHGLLASPRIEGAMRAEHLHPDPGGQWRTHCGRTFVFSVTPKLRRTDLAHALARHIEEIAIIRA